VSNRRKGRKNKGSTDNICIKREEPLVGEICGGVARGKKERRTNFEWCLEGGVLRGRTLGNLIDTFSCVLCWRITFKEKKREGIQITPRGGKKCLRGEGEGHSASFFTRRCGFLFGWGPYFHCDGKWV